jgi:hypothetical protein
MTLYKEGTRNMNDTLKAIRALEDKYGLPLFGMALTHLVDVGVRHLTNENVDASIKQITASGSDDKPQFMTPEFQCAIVRCAAELARFSIWDLFRYIKKNLTIGGN